MRVSFSGEDGEGPTPVLTKEPVFLAEPEFVLKAYARKEALRGSNMERGVKHGTAYAEAGRGLVRMIFLRNWTRSHGLVQNRRQIRLQIASAQQPPRQVASWSHIFPRATRRRLERSRLPRLVPCRVDHCRPPWHTWEQPEIVDSSRGNYDNQGEPTVAPTTVPGVV